MPKKRGGLNYDKRRTSSIVETYTCNIGLYPPKTDEEVRAFEELRKDYIPMAKDRHVDVDKIINGDIKCE